MEMTLAQVSGYGRAMARIESDEMGRAAAAARVAQADEKGWKRFIASLENGEH